MYLLGTFFPIFLLFRVSDAGLVSALLGCEKKECSESESCEKDDCSDYDCKDTCYRSYDGSCNNLDNPFWGTPNSEYIRLFNASSYSDGIYKYPELENPRKISQHIFVDTYVIDNVWTLATPMWGQYVAHDVARVKGVPQTAEEAISCPCHHGVLTDTPPESDRCCPIEIPCNDPFHGPLGTQCFDFIRTYSTYQKDPSKRAEQLNMVTSYLDGSPVYGNCEEEANSLRTKEKGQLINQIRQGRMYPPQANNENLACRDLGATDNLCIKTGDVRANQNPHIALIQTILLRCHNDIAEKLCCDINPHWDDEKCYQEARKIVIAIIQHITYDEFLPFYVGKDNARCFDKAYDDSCNVGIGNEFSTAAYRNLHSVIRGWLRLFTQHRKHEGTARLSDHFGNPSLFLIDDIELKLATGAATLNQMKVDAYYVDELTQYFFRPPNKTMGQDLATFDINRGRDHGLVFYWYALKKCGLGKPTCWDDFKKYIKAEIVDNVLRKCYKNYDDVELFVGGILETLLPGTLTGPTFNCILVEQFARLQKCDRYWYTNKHQKCHFTSDQLKSIKKGATISRLLCSYVNGFKKIQRRGFEVVSERNPLVDCNKIPCIDLSLWQCDSSSGDSRK